MSIETNKELALNFWNAFSKGDIKTAFASLSDEVSWLIPVTSPIFRGCARARPRFSISPGLPPKCFRAGCKARSGASMAMAIRC